VLNLREAGFNVQISPGNSRSADITLRGFRMESTDPSSDLVEILRASGETAPVIASDPSAVYSAERESLERRTLIPLVHLPRAFAFAGRLHNFQLLFDGAPDLGAVSLEAGK
jgi:hypothetical protein